MEQFQQDCLTVKIYPDRLQLGQQAAREAAACLRALLAQQPVVRCIFAAAPSQNEFLDALRQAEGIEWQRVEAYHMDEYLGLSSDAPQGFGNFLRNALFDHLPFAAVHLIHGCGDPQQEIQRYSQLLAQPVDIVFMGIGENGHIAFNDPPVADFEDPATIKVVELEQTCRRQQVNDGCFDDLSQVPTHALTVTIPALLRAAHIFCMVPNERKAAAVKNTLEGPIATSCPASILRTKPGAVLYLDSQSAALLRRKGGEPA